jgi:hypothetical protein
MFKGKNGNDSERLFFMLVSVFSDNAVRLARHCYRQVDRQSEREKDSRPDQSGEKKIH